MEELRRIREEAGLSQAQLARESGVDRATINKIEQGKRSPSIATLESLSRALAVEVADFFPKAQAPLPLDAPAGGERTPQEFEEALARVREPGRVEALRELQAARRLVSSEGIPQRWIGDPPEAEIAKRLVEEFTPEERPLAFAEVVLGRERFELKNALLEEALRERGQKIARLEKENAQLRDEHKQAKVEKT